MASILNSELIINEDGSVFHLNLKPGQVGGNVILVGDPGRVKAISAYFEKIEVEAQNREFISCTGTIKGKRVTVISTGIGTDNIDIVLNELDALVNIDFTTREVKSKLTSLNIVRIGTSGSLQKDLPVNSWLLTHKSIGFDGLLNFYGGRDGISDLAFEDSFKKSLSWNSQLTSPYVCNASEELINRLSSDLVVAGVTISAPGFYGPQGRVLRLPIQDSEINDKISVFRYDHWRITNYEMECSAIYGLSKLLGHNAATICLIIANRMAGTFSSNYPAEMEKLIKYTLDKLIK